MSISNASPNDSSILTTSLASKLSQAIDITKAAKPNTDWTLQCGRVFPIIKKSTTDSIPPRENGCIVTNAVNYGQTVSINGQTVSINGQTVSINGQTVLINGQTVSINGQTVLIN